MRIPPGHPTVSYAASRVVTIESAGEPVPALLTRSGAPESLRVALRYATLDERPRPTGFEMEAVTRPLRLILGIADDGIPLGPGNWMPGRVVRQVFIELGLHPEWLGSNSREDLTPSVANLRRVAVRLGLLTDDDGRLALTDTGRRLANSPAVLWEHIADHLPIEPDGMGRDAGTLELARMASWDRSPQGREFVAAGLVELGWTMRGGAPVTVHDLPSIAPTALLRTLNCYQRWGWVPSAAGAVLARAALARRTA